MVKGTGQRAQSTSRLIVHLSPELEDDIEDLRKSLVVHETAGVAKAYLGTSVGAAAATVAVIVAMLSFPPTQKMVTAFLAFIRLQIASIARDIVFQTVPTPGEVVDTIAEGAAEVEKSAREIWREVERRFEETREREITEEQPPGTPSTLDNLINALQELADRIFGDPLFGTGGQGPFVPGP